MKFKRITFHTQRHGAAPVLFLYFVPERVFSLTEFIPNACSATAANPSYVNWLAVLFRSYGPAPNAKVYVNVVVGHKSLNFRRRPFQPNISHLQPQNLSVETRFTCVCNLTVRSCDDRVYARF